MSLFQQRPSQTPAINPAKKSRFSRIHRATDTPLNIQFKRADDSSSQTKYYLISNPSQMSTTANPKTVLASVGITVAATLIAFATASSMAFNHYRIERNLPDQVFRGIFGDYTGPATVGFSMLNSWLMAGLIAVAVLYPIVHALLGRGVFSALHGLCVLSDRVFQPDRSRCISNWSAETKMLAGALWPVSMLLIPFLAVGAILGALYRRLWTEPARA